MNQKSQDRIFHKYYFFFNISNWSVNKMCLKEIFLSYFCIFICKKYSQPYRKSSKKYFFQHYFFKIVIYDKNYTFLMFFRKFDFQIVKIQVNFKKWIKTRMIDFFQNIFFHKYSLVGCQQNLVVFIFFDYSGLF